MTYCLGIKVREGLVAIADTRITSGTDTTIKKKMFTVQRDKHSFFIMTSGLRQVKRVAEEDKESLARSSFKFDLNTIIGGQLKDDEEHKLFMLYPEGNWVELGQGAPFIIIGNSGHGKAILNRTVTEELTMRQALKAGFLSFDSTRVSSNNVDFPIDIALYKKDSFNLVEHRYEKKDLENISALWAKELKNALERLPEDWLDASFNQLNPNNTT
jgi:putative proteasome-type protease